MIQRAALMLLFAFPLQAQTLSLFSDKGVPSGTVVNAWWDTTLAPASFDGHSTVVSAVEGFESWRTEGPSWAGWGVFFASPIDLTAYQNGEIRFWMYTNTADVTLSIEYSGSAGGNCFGGTKDCFDFFGTSLVSSLNQWVPISLPLSMLVRRSGVVSPFQISANGPGTVIIDNVRIVSNQNARVFDVTGPDITWNPSPGDAWVRSSNFLTLDVDPNTDTSWGVQIYTDNTGAAASPRFTSPVTVGQPGSNPAGLVDMATPNKALPLAWSIQPLGAPIPAAAVPATPLGPSWLYVKDRATPNIPSQNTTAFQDGQAYVTMVGNRGIHFSGGDTEFGAELPPYRIYFEADFSAAVSPRSYQTNRLIVEYFTP